MRVVHLSAFDLLGGASKAAFRLHRALRAAGVDSKMLVQRKTSDDPDVLALGGRLREAAAHGLDRVALRLLRADPSVHRTLALAGRRFLPELHALKPDVVHLHWAHNGLLRPEALPHIGAPIVWTLHDQWAFGGARHYAGAQTRLDAWLEARKARAFAQVKSLAFVAPSRWMAAEAVRLGRPIEVIPNAVDVAQFSPRPRGEARAALGLALEGRYVLFGSTVLGDRRKGLDLLEQAMRSVDATLLRAGRGGGMGVLDEQRMALAYSAADVVACPSREDNLPNVALEALACGTPVAGFAIGGLPDIVDSGVTGMLAPAEDVAKLAEALRWALTQPESIREAARDAAVQRFSPAVIAEKHLALYRAQTRST